jgi:hypothetical protein
MEEIDDDGNPVVQHDELWVGILYTIIIIYSMSAVTSLWYPRELGNNDVTTRIITFDPL